MRSLCAKYLLSIASKTVKGDEVTERWMDNNPTPIHERLVQLKIFCGFVVSETGKGSKWFFNKYKSKFIWS